MTEISEQISRHICPHDLEAAMKHHFGHEQFRPMQRAIICDAIAGRDLFVLMPTGSGKSLCYQLPAMISKGTTIVVSPLIALMQDQVSVLQANGINATFLNSSVDPNQIAEREAHAIAGQYPLIYMAPERMMSPAGIRLLRKLSINRIVIDEAHCISEWGHDFRPDYRQLGGLRDQLANQPISALTATATPRVIDDIIQQLQLCDSAIHCGHFERPNLNYQLRPKHRVLQQVVGYMKSNPSSEGIVYCLSRVSVDRLCDKLRAHGIDALPYHAGLDRRTRLEHQHQFVHGGARVMVATIAFGMGIDKPDVRFVIHADLPRHLEGYYQETGRAGRDGLPADCILFFSTADRFRYEHFINQKQTEHERNLARQQLQQVLHYAYTTQCRCIPLLHYFGQTHPGSCGHCDNCNNPPQWIDATKDAQKLLSTVVRTDQRFGLGYIIDVLRGSAGKRILGNHHDQLSVYGIGADQPVGYWRKLADTLIGTGQLALTQDEYHVAQLTSDSGPVLRGQKCVQVTRPHRAPNRKVIPKLAPEGPFDHILFERLRALRRNLAQKQNVPPYVVFGDASLKQMVQQRPTSLAQFVQITGVGEHKLKKYGRRFIEAIGGSSDFDPTSSSHQVKSNNS